jgi:hypothetical protein
MMKRREFLMRSMGTIGALGPLSALGQARPCPVPSLSADNGQPVTTSCAPSAFEQLAASLAAGASSTALGDTGMSSNVVYTIQWVNRFHYDHANGRAHLLGKNASSQGSQRSNCQYDVANNRWTTALYGGSEFGHVYESIAYNPANGELWTGNWDRSRTLKRWSLGASLSSWVNPATSSFSAPIDLDVQPSLCWHPTAFGPGDGGVLALHAVDDSSTVKVIAWRRQTNTWHEVAGTTHSMNGSYRSRGAMTFVTGGNHCIAAFPPGNNGRSFRIGAGSGGALATAVQIANTPIDCQWTDSGEGPSGILIDDPSGAATPFIIEKGGSNRVWKLEGGAWVRQSYNHPFPAGSPTSSAHWAIASCQPLGVFWCKSREITSGSRVWRPGS